MPTTTTSTDRTAEDKKKGAQRVSDLIAVWEALDTRWQKFFDQVERNLEYTINEQILPKVREMLRAEGRPELTFNFFITMIRYIAGTVAQNNFKMRAIPLRHGDENNAQLHTVINEWAMQQCDGDYEVAKAFVMSAMTKIGWTNNYWDTNLNKFIVRSYDPRLVRMDPDTKQEDLSDCNYVAVTGFYSAERVIQMFNITGEKAATMRKNAALYETRWKGTTTPQSFIDQIVSGMVDWWNSSSRRGHEGDERGYGGTGKGSWIDAWMDVRSGIYRVVEFHDRRRVIKNYAYDPAGDQTIEAPEEANNDPMKLQEFKDQNPDKKHFDNGKDEFWITAICPRLLEDDSLLETKYSIQDRGFQFKPVFWDTFHPDVTKSTAILDNLVSVQDFTNQRMMTWLESVMKGVNPDLLVEKGSIEPEDMDTWLSKARGKIKFFKRGTMTKPEREHPMAEVINALSGGMEMIWGMRTELSGISLNQMGMKDSGKEGAHLFQARIQAGMTMLEGPFSHLKRSMEHIFRYCDATLQKFMTMPRMVRLLSEPPKGIEGVVMDQQQQDVYWLKVNWQTMDKMVNDLSQGEYDFKPDINAIGKQAKQTAFLELKEIMDTLDPKYRFAVQPIWIRNADIPDAGEMATIMEKIRDMELGIQTVDAEQKMLAGNQALAEKHAQLTAPPEPMPEGARVGK